MSEEQTPVPEAAQDNRIKFTKNELSERLGIEPEAIYGLLVFLEGAGLAEVVGTAKPAGKSKGKGPNIYAVEPGIAARLTNILRRIELEG